MRNGVFSQDIDSIGSKHAKCTLQNKMGNGEKHVSDTERITRKKYHVSMVSSVKIAKGAVLTEEMVSYRNPGTGIPSKDAHKIIGKVLVQDIERDELLTIEMFM